jgi:hypothetical protein
MRPQRDFRLKWRELQHRMRVGNAGLTAPRAKGQRCSDQVEPIVQAMAVDLLLAALQQL